MTRPGESTLAHCAMLLYAALVAGSFSYGALAAPHIGPAPLTAARFVLASILMGMLFLVANRGLPARPTAVWRYAVLGSLMGVFFVLMFVALRITDPVSTGAVFTLIPLMSAIFGYAFLRQRTRSVVLMSLAISGIGALWVIFRGDMERALAFNIGRGEAVFLVGCACQAAYGPLVRLLNRGEPVLEFTLWTLIAASFCVCAYAMQEILETDWLALPVIVWTCLLYLAVASTAISFFLLQYASLRLHSAKVFAYGYLIPTFVIVIEGVLGHGWASLLVIIGALITVAGLVLLVATPDAAARK